MAISTGKLKAIISQIIRRLRYVTVEASADYQVQEFDDAISCDGTFNVTLLPKANIVFPDGHPIEVSSTNGTITLLADADIQGSATVTNGTSVELFFTRGQWWRK